MVSSLFLPLGGKNANWPRLPAITRFEPARMDCQQRGLMVDRCTPDGRFGVVDLPAPPLARSDVSPTPDDKDDDAGYGFALSQTARPLPSEE